MQQGHYKYKHLFISVTSFNDQHKYIYVDFATIFSCICKSLVLAVCNTGSKSEGILFAKFHWVFSAGYVLCRHQFLFRNGKVQRIWPTHLQTFRVKSARNWGKCFHKAGDAQFQEKPANQPESPWSSWPSPTRTFWKSLSISIGRFYFPGKKKEAFPCFVQRLPILYFFSMLPGSSPSGPVCSTLGITFYAGHCFPEKLTPGKCQFGNQKVKYSREKNSQSSSDCSSSKARLPRLRDLKNLWRKRKLPLFCCWEFLKYTGFVVTFLPLLSLSWTT